MRSRTRIGLALALAALTPAAFGGSQATAVLQADGLEEAAFLSIPDVSHFDFFTRTIGGEERVIAMVGSRSTALKDPSKPLAQQPIVDGTPAGGLNLVDVTDPENPEFLLNVYCPTGNNDVAYIDAQHRIDTSGALDPVNGVLYDGFVLLASNDGTSCSAQMPANARGGVAVVGLRAEPLEGESISATWFASPFKTPEGARFSWAGRDPAAHTVVAHPSEPIAYVGNQNLADRSPSVEVLDLGVWPPVGKSHLIGIPVNASNVVPQTALNGPHDITFSPDGRRAYVSAITGSYIWDTSGDKVRAPETISSLVSPNLKIHHETILHPNGRHLLTVDEFVATSNENIPVCPGGGIHVFDTGPLQEDGTRLFERAPVSVGQFYADELGTVVPFHVGVDVDETGVTREVDLSVSCTAHEFNIPDSGTWMPLGWFGAGVRMLDLSSLMDPEVVNAATPTPVTLEETGYFVAEGTDVWAAKQHPLLPGYVFVTDTAFGFRVLRIL